MTVSGSTLALTPEDNAWGVGANTEPDHPARRLFAADTALTRAGYGYFDWLDHVWPAAGCTHPIRLYGELATVDTATGRILDTAHTSAMPDSVIYKACGNRRAAACPSCAETYRRDAYHLIRAGLAGGKGVPDHVAAHPAVFATLTAPSFGVVHARVVKHHTCADRAACSCRPEPCHARRDADTCRHGHLAACYTRHGPADPELGQPLCLDCYDHAAQVVWNNAAGELWRRTKQAIERHLNHAARRRGLPPVRVAHGKAAEFQARGAVHFHALLRLDGVDPDNPDAVVQPPVGLTVVDLDDATRHAAAAVVVTTAPHPLQPGGWRIAWGDQVDIRVISARSGGSSVVTDAMVAGYLAKYATKSTETTGHTSRRLTPDTVAVHADPHGSHPARLVHACWTLGAHPAHRGLRRWAHMLGFGGHFLTKARRYSVPFGALRAARIHYRRTQTPGAEHAPIRTAEHTGEETTLIVGRLTYAGAGWRTTGDALLANTAADQARARQHAGREDLVHHCSTDREEIVRCGSHRIV